MRRRHIAARGLTAIKAAALATATMMLLSILVSSAAEARCGSRGGPGYRRADGKCASHRD